MTDLETQTGIPVTPAEVAEVLENFRPGDLVPSFKIFLAYGRLMKSYGQPLASRVALGRALTAAGCERARKRKRVKGLVEETHCWRIAGSVPNHEEDQQAWAAVRQVGGGIIPESRLYEAYSELAVKNGWRGRMARATFARVLTRIRLHRMTDKGEKCRFIGKEHLPT